MEELKQTQNNDQDEEGTAPSGAMNILPALEKQLILEAATADMIRKTQEDEINVKKIVEEKGKVKDVEKVEEKGKVKMYAEKVEEKNDEVEKEAVEIEVKKQEDEEKIEEKDIETENEEKDIEQIEENEDKIPHRDVENTEIGKEKEMDIIVPDENANIPKVKVNICSVASSIRHPHKLKCYIEKLKK